MNNTTKAEKLSNFLGKMKHNQLKDSRECWGCIDHIVRFHIEKMSDEEVEAIFK
jgi:hypothetical protein